MNDSGAAKQVTAGARTIHLHDIGNGPPVLMLHGGGPGASGLSNYSRNIDALAKRFRLLVPDMPGYGASTKGIDQADPFGDLAQAMVAMLDSLGIERTHVVGNSLGGACALRMALERPDRVDRLVLMGPGGINTTRSLPTRGLLKFVNYYRDKEHSIEKLREFISYLVYEPAKVPEALIMERFKASIDPEVLANPPIQPRRFPTRKSDLTRDRRLASLQNPVLVLWGKEDRVNRASGGWTLLRTLPNCDLYLFGHTGHWVQWERSDEFNAVTEAFLAQAPTERCAP